MTNDQEMMNLDDAVKKFSSQGITIPRRSLWELARDNGLYCRIGKTTFLTQQHFSDLVRAAMAGSKKPKPKPRPKAKPNTPTRSQKHAVFKPNDLVGADPTSFAKTLEQRTGNVVSMSEG